MASSRAGGSGAPSAVLCDQTLLGLQDLDLGGEAQMVIVALENAKEDFQRQYTPPSAAHGFDWYDRSRCGHAA